MEQCGSCGSVVVLSNIISYTFAKNFASLSLVFMMCVCVIKKDHTDDA